MPDRSQYRFTTYSPAALTFPPLPQLKLVLSLVTPAEMQGRACRCVWQVLLNYEWLHAKLSAMSLHDILSDYRSAIESGSADSDVQLVFSALRVGGTYVSLHPDTLAFDLLGRLLVYYDTHVGIRSDSTYSPLTSWFIACLRNP